MSNPDKLAQKWRQAEATGAPVKVGDLVVCDACNTDYTDSTASGGIIFGSHAWCPPCAERALPIIARHGEGWYIRSRCPAGMSFADFVRLYRGPDATVQIRPWRRSGTP